MFVGILRELRQDGMQTFAGHEHGLFKSHLLTGFLIRISNAAINYRITPREYYYIMARAEAAALHHMSLFRSDQRFPSATLLSTPEPYRNTFPSTDNIMFP